MEWLMHERTQQKRAHTNENDAKHRYYFRWCSCQHPPFFYGFSVSPRYSLCSFSVTASLNCTYTKKTWRLCTVARPTSWGFSHCPSSLNEQRWSPTPIHIIYLCCLSLYIDTLKDRHRDTYIPTGHSPLLCFRLDPELCENSKRSKPKRQVNAFSKYALPPFAPPAGR